MVAGFRLSARRRAECGTVAGPGQVVELFHPDGTLDDVRRDPECGCQIEPGRLLEVEDETAQRPEVPLQHELADFARLAAAIRSGFVP